MAVAHGLVVGCVVSLQRQVGIHLDKRVPG